MKKKGVREKFFVGLRFVIVMFIINVAIAFVLGLFIGILVLLAPGRLKLIPVFISYIITLILNIIATGFVLLNKRLNRFIFKGKL